MNQTQEAIEQLKKGISDYVDYAVQNAPLDKTVTGLIYQIHQKSENMFTYDVIVNGKTYYDVKTIGGTCVNNETVKVLIPQNNFNNIIILKGGNGSGSGGDSSAVKSVNGKIGEVILNASDVGALSANTTASDIGALSDELDTTLTSETLAPQSKIIGEKFTTIEGLIGDIGTILDEINGEVI